MVPSSFIISTKTPAGSKPANLAKSIVASVCPVRRKTPPFLARKGKICPGLPKSSGFVSGFIKACTVLALSDAEIPVVQPCPFKSILTVKGVSCKTVLFLTIKSKPNSSHLSSIKGAQIKPLPCVAMKLIISGVTLRAAVKKSPSFSRSSSSTTIINFPAFISSIASGIEFNVFCIKIIFALGYFLKKQK